MTKDSLRKHFREVLRAEDPETLENASADLVREIARLLHERATVALFAASPTEPDFSDLHQLRPDLQLCYPRSGPNSALTFHLVTNTSQLSPGVHGILAPPPHSLVPPTHLDFILVPGLAFSKTGARLGQGGGYYDRYLPQAPQARKIGTAFSIQELQEIPLDQHDILMDEVRFGQVHP